MGVKFSENENIKEVFVWPTQATGFIKRSAKLLGILRDAGQFRPRKASNVRWYSRIDMVEGLLSAKDMLTSLRSTTIQI